MEYVCQHDHDIQELKSGLDTLKTDVTEMKTDVIRRIELLREELSYLKIRGGLLIEY